MKFISKVILICSVGYLGWVCPLTMNLFAQQLDALQAFITGNWLMNDLNGNALQAIIPDFQVNENAGGSGKGPPVMGADGKGNAVVAWADSRDGYTRIYAQRLDRSCNPLGTNFQVDDEAGSSEQYLGDIAVRENGDFVIVWLETNSLSTSERENEIVARMFDGSGTALSKPFKVSEESSLPFNPPFIAMDRSGNFMIVWQDDRLGNDAIFAQIHDSTGSPLGQNFKVTDDSSSAWYPQIVTMGNDEFMVAWRDNRSGNASIYAQRYNKIGTALEPNSWLAGGDGNVTDFALAANKPGDTVVVWDEWQDDHRDLLGLLYNYPEPALSESFLVNDDTLKRGFAFESVAVGPLGDFCVTWHGDEEDQDVVFARWFNRDGAAKGSSKKVNEGYHVAYNVMPSIVADASGNYLLAWVDYRNDRPDLYAQRFDSSGKALGANFKMNEDFGGADQLVPDISANANGAFVVVWVDYREYFPLHNFIHDSNIYAKRFNAAGIALGKDFKVNDDPTANYIWSPKVAIAPSGKSIVVWYEYRKGNWDVYAQFFSAKGAPVGANMLVSVDTGKVDNQFPDIAVDANDNFVIVWSGSILLSSSNFFRGIFARRYNSFGTPIGSGIKVAESGSHPVVAMAPNGDFMVVWKATGISAQIYNSAGIPQGAVIKVNPRGLHTPAVAVDGDGNYFIVWLEDVNPNWEIYARRYDRYGKALGEKFKVTAELRGDWQANLSVSSDQDGHVLVVWNDNREGYWDIMAQRYDAQGQPVGVYFCPVQHTSLDQEWPRTEVVNGKIYLAWHTNHVGGTGYDIWANVLDWSSPEKTVEDIDFRLWQNYPNPFNQGTKIRYAVSEAGPTTIKIYNLTSSLVRVLMNEMQSQGSYEIVWDGKDAHGQAVASGIYFYQLKSGRQSMVRRMVLLR